MNHPEKVDEPGVVMETRNPEAMEAAPAAPILEAPEALRAVGEKVVEQLKTVYDPEIPVDIYELGLIYGVKIDESGATSIRMTLTTPMCPAAEELPPEVESKARSVEGVTSVTLDLVWDPPWSPEMMSEAARLQLGMI
jgi:FeS assembly SUF system protein